MIEDKQYPQLSMNEFFLRIVSYLFCYYLYL